MPWSAEEVGQGFHTGDGVPLLKRVWMTPMKGAKASVPTQVLEFVDVAVLRWEAFTGEKARREEA